MSVAESLETVTGTLQVALLPLTVQLDGNNNRDFCSSIKCVRDCNCHFFPSFHVSILILVASVSSDVQTLVLHLKD